MAQIVRHLGDGRWWDEQQQAWRDGRGRRVPSPTLAEDAPVRTTKVVLAAAHLDHDPATADVGIATSKRSASAAICCTTGPEHRRRIRLTLRRRRALGDLFLGPYPAS